MLPKLEEDILIDKAEGVVEFVDHASEDALLLGLGLWLVAGARRRIGHCDLGRLLIGHAQAGGQGPRGLREGKLLLLLCAAIMEPSSWALLRPGPRDTQFLRLMLHPFTEKGVDCNRVSLLI